MEAEDRLEAALERIARIVDIGTVARPAEAQPDLAAIDVAGRLDRIIDTLREALGK